MNYFTDHPEIGFYLNHPLMARIVELKEKGFADAKEYDYAPVDLGDAIENYKQILDITGDVAANIIEPNAESVDLEGPHLENGRMITPLRPTRTSMLPARLVCGESQCPVVTAV